MVKWGTRTQKFKITLYKVDFFDQIYTKSVLKILLPFAKNSQLLCKLHFLCLFIFKRIFCLRIIYCHSTNPCPQNQTCPPNRPTPYTDIKSRRLVPFLRCSTRTSAHRGTVKSKKIQNVSWNLYWYYQLILKGSST